MNKQNKILKAAIYTRKSCIDKTDKFMTSCEAQRKMGENFAQREGFAVLETLYDDYGYTGANTDRPALKRLLLDLSEGKIDIVIVYKLDRITRSLQDFAYMWKHYFQPFDVLLRPIEGKIDMGSANGRFTTTVIMAAAELERELIGERIKSKKQTTLRSGYWSGGVPPLGYKNEKKINS